MQQEEADPVLCGQLQQLFNYNLFLIIIIKIGLIDYMWVLVEKAKLWFHQLSVLNFVVVHHSGGLDFPGIPYVNIVIMVKLEFHGSRKPLCAGVVVL